MFLSRKLFLFSILVSIFAYLLKKEYFSKYKSVIKDPDKVYDYIIVGAGTTGCVLAARLSENPSTRVLLVEAGDFINFFVKVPIAPTIAQMGPSDWSYRTTMQKYSSFGMINQTHILPRGKGLGGSGQINYLLHSPGLLTDFDELKKLGIKGWTFSDIAPYYKKIFGSSEWEHNCLESHKCQIELTTAHSVGLTDIFRRASKYNGKKVHFFKPTATLKDAKRMSSYEAFLKPAMNRDNLHILTNTQAVSVRFDGKNASSLYILKRKFYLDNIFAEKEIILCAGVIKTPQILMLSGIGPKQVLKKHKLRILETNNYVGSNLHDNSNMPIYVSIEKPLSITLDNLFTLRSIWDYIFRNSGPLSFPPVAGIEIMNNKTALTIFSLGSANEHLLRDLSNYKTSSFRKTFPHHTNPGREGFIFLASCLQPKSRGSVTIASEKISDQPHIDPNYFAHSYDIKCILRAMRRAITLITTKPFIEIGAKIHWPMIERCLHFWNAKNISNVYLECIVREMAVTAHHMGGTCSMGKVVDSQFRVKSLKRLRVVDSSVLAAPITPFPNSFLIAMADRAADFIIRDHHL